MIIALTIVAVCFVSVRVVFLHFFSKRRLGAADWTVIAAIPLGLTTVALTIFGLTAHGLGIDIWGLQASQATDFGRYFYAIQILYVLLITMVKLALVLFYLSIFFGRTILILLWATVAVHIAGAVAFCIAITFQCLPIRYQWERYNYANNPLVEGRCINTNAGGWANAAINVASDIWMLALPLSQLKKLRLHWKKKLGAALMFFTGTMQVAGPRMTRFSLANMMAALRLCLFYGWPPFVTMRRLQTPRGISGTLYGGRRLRLRSALYVPVCRRYASCSCAFRRGYSVRRV